MPRVGRESPASASNPVWVQWAGEYELMPGFVLRIFERDGRLMGQATGQGAFELTPSDGDKVEAKAKRIAAAVMESSPDDVEFKNGTFTVKGTDKKMAFGEVALSAYVAYAAFSGANQSLAAPGFQKFPGGLIERWGSFYAGNAPVGNNTAAITFATAFPTALLSLSLTVQDQNSANNLVVSFKDPDRFGFTLQYQETAAAVQDATIHYIARGY